MTDDLVKRLYNLPSYEEGVEALAEEAADRIEKLEHALRSIAEVPLGAEILDRTTTLALAIYMQETAKDALKEGKDG